MVIVFDLLGTIFSYEKVEEIFQEHEMPPEVSKLWVARLLQAGMAATMADRYVPFRQLAETTLQQILSVMNQSEALTSTILERMKELEPYPDVAECIQTLQAEGHRLIVLTNTSVEAADALLEKAGLRDAFDMVLSADETGSCKPDPRPYRAAAKRAGCPASEICLVAAHGWDIMGANAVGMKTVWVERLEKWWTFPGDPPGLVAPSLTQLPTLIRNLG